MQLQNPQLLRQQALIGNEWQDADSQARFDVANPANGAVISSVPDMGAAETRRAIAAADAAWPAWRQRTAKERSNILRKWYELVMANQEDLAQLMTAEQGKPLAEARGEVAYAASFIEWFAEEARRSYGDVVPSPANDRRIVVIKQPVGVTAAITPWNFPLAMITRKAAPALAAGCTMILKPAEQTPLSALALAYLAQQAGVPAGVLNVITGDAVQIGGVLTSSEVVRKLSFTGSTAVGRLLARQSADTLKKLSLELGGNAPFVVFDDADLDAAADGAMASKFRNTGQTCVCANRILVQAGVYDAFAAKLTARVAALKVAPGNTDGATQGPLIDNDALRKVEEHVADALAKGARLATGGARHALGGTFYQPTVLLDATPEMQLAQEETFGPVAGLFRFDSEAEAIELANATEFGLSAYFYSRDMARVWRVAEALEVGMVGINTGVISHAEAPFGGVKQSGLGREGGKYGIDEYLELKYLCMGGL
ncbi:NAD-dependent succinate-semialdehyde dehydrogenase [Collimonas sp.]|jgi:succinate-semialdehyde dehydrogenase/glutarate-semialdehyde dehydrogenase|uniref:NAD-dependent succinate-semialdehyde dehydrogenase n=1 Tax=Collimonas sp. TaxID=1963772 RepID=UPI002CAB5B16|nr:NAD-dependent succinate-semialdehyde dehydrogenase [Collimonas sp.]HWX04098.1 NAD-dependent succinate-semialdehyde dehydrogenase [Collimonas sp.]